MRDYPEFENPQQRPRYTGLPTFMRTPYRKDMEGLDIALGGIPFEGESPIGPAPGTDQGKSEISLP